MTYDRMEAKPIPGQCCQFCGDDSAPLVRTSCCEKWICCDTAFFSNGGGYCQVQHETYSLCHFHYNEKHQGDWRECKECLTYFGKDEFERMAEDWTNTPHY